MNKNLKLLSLLAIIVILPVAVFAALHSQTFSQHASSEPCTQHVTFFANNFLKATGSYFAYMGFRECLYGATIYTSSGSGAPSGSWSDQNFTQRIDWDLHMAQSANMNFIRLTNYADSANSDPYSPTVWRNIDYLISQSQTKGIFILMDLSSYAKHLESQGINPYDPSQDAGWQQFIRFVTNRINTYTNVSYKDTPNIAYYSMRGEVNPVGSTFPSASTQGYLDFYTRLTNGVFAADGNHLIEAGGLTHLNSASSGIPWQQIFSLPHVNIASIHVYAANRLDPINGSNDLHITLPMVASWAQQNKKPVDLQEYGIINQVGDAVRANAMKTIEAAAIQNGYQSIVYWNLGPETTPGFHYDVNPSFPLAWQQFSQGALDFYGGSLPQIYNPIPAILTPIANAIQTIFHASSKDIDQKKTDIDKSQSTKDTDSNKTSPTPSIDVDKR